MSNYKTLFGCVQRANSVQLYNCNINRLQQMKTFSNPEQVKELAKQQNRVLVVKDGEVLDVTEFAYHHPGSGGSGLLLTYKGKDISEEFRAHQKLTYRLADSMVVGTFKKEIKRLIEPDKALMPQIWDISKEDYLELINSPHWLFVPSPRMFQTDFFEMFSHNKWYHVLVAHFVFYSCVFTTCDFSKVEKPLNLIPVFLIGMFLFSLAEYVLHRFLFHSEHQVGGNRLLRYLHFILHGIHHTFPSDPDRLVYPPILAGLFVVIGYFTIYPLLGGMQYEVRLIGLLGFGVGYLMYDMVHYALHHIEAQAENHWKKLQRYHNMHHYSGQEAAYGVTSKFWDIVFGTQLIEPSKIA